MGKWIPGRSMIHGVGHFAHPKPIAIGEEILSEAPLLERVATRDAEALSAAHDKMLEDLKKLDRQSANSLRLLVQRHNQTFKGISSDDFARQLQDPSFALQAALIETFFATSFPRCSKTKAAVHRMFRDLSSINHSCNPNAEASWDAERNHMVLHATKAIALGEEILISYIDQFQVREARHEAPNFECRCAPCTGSEDSRGSFEDSMKVLAPAFEVVHDFLECFDDSDDPVAVLSSEQTQTVTAEKEVFDLISKARVMDVICREHDMNHSKIAMIYQVLYIISATARETYVDDRREALEERAYNCKCRELQTLGQCLGVKHWRTRRVMHQALNWVHGSEERVQKLASILAHLGLRLTIRYRDRFVEYHVLVTEDDAQDA